MRRFHQARGRASNAYDRRGGEEQATEEDADNAERSIHGTSKRDAAQESQRDPAPQAEIIAPVARFRRPPALTQHLIQEEDRAPKDEPARDERDRADLLTCLCDRLAR